MRYDLNVGVVPFFMFLLIIVVTFTNCTVDRT